MAACHSSPSLPVWAQSTSHPTSFLSSPPALTHSVPLTTLHLILPLLSPTPHLSLSCSLIHILSPLHWPHRATRTLSPRVGVFFKVRQEEDAGSLIHKRVTYRVVFDGPYYLTALHLIPAQYRESKHVYRLYRGLCTPPLLTLFPSLQHVYRLYRGLCTLPLLTLFPSLQHVHRLYRGLCTPPLLTLFPSLQHVHRLYRGLCTPPLLTLFPSLQHVHRLYRGLCTHTHTSSVAIPPFPTTTILLASLSFL